MINFEGASPGLRYGSPYPHWRRDGGEVRGSPDLRDLRRSGARCRGRQVPARSLPDHRDYGGAERALSSQPHPRAAEGRNCLREDAGLPEPPPAVVGSRPPVAIVRTTELLRLT